MRGTSIRTTLLPVLLAGALGACANNGVQPGYVNTASGGSSATAQTYGNAQPGAQVEAGVVNVGADRNRLEPLAVRR